MKAIHKRTIVYQREIAHSLSERHILTQLSLWQHPFLVKLYGCFQNVSTLFYIFDYYPGGDLATQLSLFRFFGPERVRFYAAEIVLGLEALHQLGVVYRDLKPENLLLDSEGHLALTDFGLSKQLEDIKTNVHIDNQRNSSSKQQEDGFSTTQTFCGTAEYLAPEILQGYPYTAAVDVWSFGTLLYEMALGITPFWADRNALMYQKILSAPLAFPPAFDTCLANLLSGMLRRDPAYRLSIRQVKMHPYFSPINFVALYEKRLPAPFKPQPSFCYFEKEFTDLPARLTPMDEVLSTSMQLPFLGFSYKI
jgi:serine/threonine protein kinase